MCSTITRGSELPEIARVPRHVPPDHYKWQSHAGIISAVSAVFIASVCNWLRAVVADCQPLTTIVNRLIDFSARSARSRGSGCQDSCLLETDAVVERYQRFWGNLCFHPQGRRVRREWREVGYV